MSCSQMPLLQRLAVESPGLIRREPWRSHLTGCPTCREEQGALERSLVVFRRLESEGRERAFNVPAWEDFARRLAGLEQRRGAFSRLRVPLAAATALMILTSGLLFWPEGPVLRPRPAKIVTLKPEQHRQLRVATREPAELRFVAGGAPIAAQPAVAPLLGPPAPPGAEESVATVDPGSQRTEQVTRAPVLLFRSLQQQHTMRQDSGPWPRTPLDVMPATAPYVVDPAFIGRAPRSPLPVR